MEVTVCVIIDKLLLSSMSSRLISAEWDLSSEKGVILIAFFKMTSNGVRKEQIVKPQTWTP